MIFKTVITPFAMLILLADCLAGCQGVQSETLKTSDPAIFEATSLSPVSSSTPAVIPDQPAPTLDLAGYAFPDPIDPARQYLFYLHGKNVDDQGIPAVSPEYGEFEYEAILEKLGSFGYVVISEQRSKDTDGIKYAGRVAEQVTALLETGVPAKNITVVGASKGAGITIYISHFLENEDLNYVLMAICAPETVADLIQNQVTLNGNVLSIYDSRTSWRVHARIYSLFQRGRGLTAPPK